MRSFERGRIHRSAVLADDVELGVGVTVGPFAVLHDGVRLGDGVTVGSHCVLGEPTSDFYGDEPGGAKPCLVGAGSIVRSHTVIYRGVTIGAGFECGHRVTLREGTVIGDGVRVGTMSDLQGDLTIGDHVRIHSNVFVAQRTTVEDFVWLFPGVLLTNDPHPPSDTCTDGPVIRRFAVVAARAVVMPGIEVGERSVVGAMSLVTHDVPGDTVVVGVPARPVGPTSDVRCKQGALDHVYPWPDQFRRGYPEGVLPEPGTLG